MAGEWQPVCLGEVSDLLTGFPFRSEQYVDDPAAPRLLRGDNVAQGVLRWDGAKRWPIDGLDGLAAYELSEGDVILAMDRPWIEAGLKCASVRPSDLPCLLVQRVARLRGTDRLDTGYLKHLIASRAFTEHVLAMQTGTAVPHISGAQIKSFEFRLPPLSEQRAIAHILGTLDDKIELNREVSETLDAMARALFKSWFVDFDPVRAKAQGRDPGLPEPLADLFPSRLVDSELGEIPERWEVVALGGLIETVKGRSYKSEELVESDTALVTLKSFARGGGYRPDGLKSFAGPYKAEQVVKPGDLVIACTDVTQAAEVIGRPAIVRGTSGYKTLVASLDTLIVRPRHSSMTRAFLYFLGGTEAFVGHTYAHTTGTTVLHLAKEAVPSFMFARPSTQLIEQFDALAGSTTKRIQALEEESDTLAATRDSLLPKLISGKLRVKDAARIVEAAA